MLPHRTFRAAALLTLLTGGAGTAYALYHLRLEKSLPGKDETLKASPVEVRLWYSEKPEVRLSTITIQGRDSAKVTLGKVRPTEDPNSIAADIADTLRPGTYVVKWKTAGRDGHALRGSYTFSIGK
jgi:methionine-rich copper-binding protein CopC